MSEITAVLPAAASGPDHPLKEFWKYFSENKGAVAGLCFILTAILVAVFADFLAPHSPFEQYRDAILAPPFWQDGGTMRFFLGTDDVGRDILSRLIYGARLSLFVGVLSVTLSLSLGIILGLCAGFFEGAVEIVIMRLMDIMLALPSLLLAMAIVAVLGPSLQNAIVAISVIMLPHYVRLTRASVMSEKGQDYVTASRVCGAGTLRLMFVVLLPNCMAPLIVQATLGFSSAILDAAALGFWAWGPSRLRRNGVPCWPMPCSLSRGPGGW